MTEAPAPFDSDAIFVESVFRYLDDELSSEMIERLNGFLSTSPRHRTLFNDIALQSLALKEYGAASENPAQLAGGEARAPTERNRAARTLPRRPTAIVAASLIVVLAVCLGFWWFSDGRVALNIAVVSGDVLITNVHGESRPARAGDDLAPDETLFVEDSAADVELTLESSLRINVSGPAEAIWTADRDLIVREGEFDISVSAESPLQLETPHTSLVVQDAEFMLLATDTWTEIEVRSGAVALASDSSGEMPTVVADETAIAQQGFPLVIRETVQRVPTEWSEDFENGLPFGWQGRLVANGLPGGSRGGVGVMTDSQPGGTQFLINATADEQTIRVLLTEHSHFNVTYKLAAPTWFNLFILTHTVGESDYVLSRFETASFLERADEWRTVRIPVKEFQSKSSGEFINEPPAVGAVVVGVMFSAFDNDLDLTIDEISITSAGPGMVTFESPGD